MFPFEARVVELVQLKLDKFERYEVDGRLKQTQKQH